MTATVHTQDVSASPFTLSQTDQIPFFFCAIPYHLIDDDVFPQLKGNHIKLLLVIDRYRNLKLKQRKFDQQLLSGWTIPVSQQVLADRCGVKRPTINNLVEELIGFGLLEKQLDDKSGRYRYRLTAYKVTSEEVKKMRYQHEMATEETMGAQEIKHLQEEVEALKERIEADIQPQENEELIEVNPTCQEIEQGGVKSSDILKDNLKDTKITSTSSFSFFSSSILTSAPGPVVSISTVFFSSCIVPPMINYDEVRIRDLLSSLKLRHHLRYELLRLRWVVLILRSVQK